MPFFKPHLIFINVLQLQMFCSIPIFLIARIAVSARATTCKEVEKVTDMRKEKRSEDISVFDTYMKYYKFVAVYTGFWINPNKYIYILLHSYHLVELCLLSYTQIAYLYVIRHDFVQLCVDSPWYFSTIYVWSIFFTYVTRRNEVHRMMNIIDDFYKSVLREYNDIVLKHLRFCQSITKFITCMSTLSLLSMYSMMVMAMYIFCYRKKSADSSACIRKFIFVKGTFSNVKMICLLFGLIHPLYFINLFVLFTVISICLAFSQFAIMEVKLDEISHLGDSGSAADEQKFAQNLRSCIISHQFILKTANLTNQIIQIMVFNGLFCTLCLITLSIYIIHLILKSSNHDVLLSIIPICFTAMILLFLFCAMGDEVTQFNEVLRSSLFYTSWTSLNHKTVQNLRTFSIKCNYPIVIKYFGNLFLSLDTYVKVLKTCVSYFTVLESIS